MSNQEIAYGVSKWGLKAKNWMTWSFKFGFAFLFIVYLFAHAIALGIQEKNAEVVLIELGKEIVSPLNMAHEIALQVLENPPVGIFSTLWAYMGFYFAIYQMYLWIKLFMWLIEKSPLSGINVFQNFMMAFILLFLIHIGYVGFIIHDPQPLTNTIKAPVNIFKAVVYLVANTNFSTANVVKNITSFCNGTETCII